MIQKKKYMNKNDNALKMEILANGITKEALLKYYNESDFNYRNFDNLTKFISFNDDSKLNQIKLMSLRKNLLYLADIKEFNDPLEGSFYVEESYNNFDKTIIANKIRECQSHFKVCSLNTYNENNIFHKMNMWSYYANSHNGICIEYDSLLSNYISNTFDLENILSENDLFMSCSLFNINYSINKVCVDDNYIDSAYNNNFKAIETLLTKGKEWKTEQECRLIVDIKNEYSKNYLEIIDGKTYIKAPPIKKIYLGCKLDINIKKEIVKMANLDIVNIHNIIELEGDDIKYFLRKKKFDYKAFLLKVKNENLSQEERDFFSLINKSY